MLQSIEPITALLGLVTPIMDLAQLPAMKLPEIGSGGDIDALEKSLTALDGVVKSLTDVVEGLGGPCS